MIGEAHAGDLSGSRTADDDTFGEIGLERAEQLWTIAELWRREHQDERSRGVEIGSQRRGEPGVGSVLKRINAHDGPTRNEVRPRLSSRRAITWTIGTGGMCINRTETFAIPRSPAQEWRSRARTWRCFRVF